MKQVLRDAAAELREPMNWVLVAVLFAFFALGQRLDMVASHADDLLQSEALRDAIHSAALTERKERAAAKACGKQKPIWIDAITVDCVLQQVAKVVL